MESFPILGMWHLFVFKSVFFEAFRSVVSKGKDAFGLQFRDITGINFASFPGMSIGPIKVSF